jgi:hypothetical protein
MRSPNTKTSQTTDSSVRLALNSSRRPPASLWRAQSVRTGGANFIWPSRRNLRLPLLIAALLVVSADPALAEWWIVRASDDKCLVVDIEPARSDKTVTKVGKDVYQTPEQAEADVKQLCKGSKAEDQPPRDPGNPE